MHRFLVGAFAIATLGLLGGHALMTSDSVHADPTARISVTSTVPADAIAGQPPFLMKLYGNGFPTDVPNGQVFVIWNGTPVSAAMKSSTEIHIRVTDEMIASAGSVQIGVREGTGPVAYMAHEFNIYRSSGD